MGVFGHAACQVHESPRLIPSKTAGGAAATSSVPSANAQPPLVCAREAMPPGVILPFGPTPRTFLPEQADQPEMARAERAIPPALPWLPTARRSDPPNPPDSIALVSSRAARGPTEAATAFLPTARHSDPPPALEQPAALRRPEGPPAASPGFMPSLGAAPLPTAPGRDLWLLEVRKARMPDEVPPAAWTVVPVVAATGPPPELVTPGWLLRARRQEEAIPLPRVAFWPAPSRPASVVQINVVLVGFRDVRVLSSTDPDVVHLGFRSVRLVGFRESTDAGFRDVRDLHAE